MHYYVGVEHLDSIIGRHTVIGWTGTIARMKFSLYFSVWYNLDRLWYIFDPKDPPNRTFSIFTVYIQITPRMAEKRSHPIPKNFLAPGCTLCPSLCKLVEDDGVKVES